MNCLAVALILLIAVSLVSSQFQGRTSPRRNFIRPMTRSFVGRRGPVPPSPISPRRPSTAGNRPPGFKPPVGIAKKLNEAVDFRALARVLLRQ